MDYTFGGVLPGGDHDLFSVGDVLGTGQEDADQDVSSNSEEEVEKKFLLVEEGESYTRYDECNSK